MVNQESIVNIEKIFNGKIYNETSGESYINKFSSGPKLNDILIIKK